MGKRFLPEKGPDPFFRAAQLALVLTLAVVIAAAGIRHGVDPSLLRPVHRVAATLAVPVVLWMAWRSLSPATAVALVLTAALSIVGIVGGRNPPPAIAATNLLGGLALAALLAWIAGKRCQEPFLRERFLAPFLMLPILFLLAVQISLGAWISVAGSQRVLPMHGVLAMLVAGLAGWYALARLDGVAAKVLFAAALATPLAGMTSLHFEWSPLAALAHSSAAALLACAVTYAIARRA